MLKDENEFDNLFFLSFLQWRKQTRNEIKFQLHSFCFSFLQCLMIISNSRKTKSIVIFLGLWFEKAWFRSNWSKWSKSQPHLQSMFWICFVFFLDLRIVEIEKCGKRFEICLFATIGEIRERKNERKVRFFAFVKLDETPSQLDWLNGWNWLQSNKQRFRQRQNSIFFFFFQRVREMRFSLVSIPSFRHFFEWHFREQEHLKRESGNEMGKYLLLANRQCSKMNLLHNECCFQWDLECLVKSNQIKSNQIKSNHTFQYHISHTMVNNTITISLYFSEWRKI